MKRMALLIVLITALPILAQEPVPQEPPALVKARKDYEAKIKAVVAPITADYLRQLDKMMKTLGGKGDLAGAQAVKREIEAVQASPVVSDTKQAPGKWQNVLPHVDVNKDRVTGTWQVAKNKKMIATDGKVMCSRIMLPVKVKGGYDLSLKFTRQAGTEAVCISIPVETSWCTVAFSSWAEGNNHGIEFIDGRCSNVTTVRPGTLINGHRYSALISVRLKGKEVSIEVYLDGKPLCQWSGNCSSLSGRDLWATPDAKRPSLGAAGVPVIFEAVTIRAVSGGRVAFVR